MPELSEGVVAYDTSMTEEAKIWEEMMEAVSRGDVSADVLSNIPADAVGKMVAGFNDAERLFVLKTVLEKRTVDAEAKRVGLEDIRVRHREFLVKRRSEKIDVNEITQFVEELNAKINGSSSSTIRETLQALADYWYTTLLKAGVRVEDQGN